MPEKAKKEDRPDFRPLYWDNYLVPLWEREGDFFAGLHTDALKKKYLREQLGEHEKVYEARVKTVAFVNRLKPAVKAHAGLLSDFNLTEETPRVITDWAESVDGMGRSLKSWLLDWDVEALRKNGVLCVVDMPQVEDERTNRQPRIISVALNDVYAPLVTEIEGEMTIALLSICRSEMRSVGMFGQMAVNKYWVYRLEPLDQPINVRGRLQRYQATWQEWEDEISSEGKKTNEIVPSSEPAVLRDASGMPLDRIPVVWYSPYGDPLLFHSVDNMSDRGGTPEYMPLVDLNNEYLNKQSELNTAESRANFAMLVLKYPGKAGDDKKPGDVLLNGRMLVLEDGGEGGLLEPKCTAIAATQQGQRDRRKEMDAMAQSFLTGGEQERTATEAVIESTQSRLSLRGMARRKESAVAQIFRWVMQFSDPSFSPSEDVAGGITVSERVLEAPPDPQMMLFWLNAFTQGVFDVSVFIAALKEMGAWSDEIDKAMASMGASDRRHGREARNEEVPLGLTA